jgi:hypothetical protein
LETLKSTFFIYLSINFYFKFKFYLFILSLILFFIIYYINLMTSIKYFFLSKYSFFHLLFFDPTPISILLLLSIQTHPIQVQSDFSFKINYSISNLNLYFFISNSSYSLYPLTLSTIPSLKPSLAFLYPLFPP